MEATYGDDHATMIATLRERMPPAALALVLGVRERELDEIAAGHAPSADVLERLRMLYRTHEDGTLDEATSLAARGGAFVPLASLPLVRRLFIAFLVVDALLVAGAALLFALR